MPLGDSTDGRVTRHLRDQIQIHGYHRGLEAHARARPRRFTAGVTGADHHDVVFLLHAMIVATMKILVLGSGGREHALCWKLAQSPDVEVFAMPGNPGIASVGRCIPEAASFLEIAERIGADLTVVGPEMPLVNGIVDEFRAKGMLIVGPDRSAARLEGSKIFAKRFFAQR